MTMQDARRTEVREALREPTVARQVRLLLRNREAMFGAVSLAVLAVAVFAAPVLAPHGPADLIGAPYEAPSRSAILGTDYLGEDVLSRVLDGGRSVMWMSVLATILATVIGGTLGILGGYLRNAVDDVIVFVMDVLLAFPQMVFILLFTSLMGREPWFIVVLVALGWVPPVGRLARSATLQVVEQDFVLAAEVLGYARWKIVLREILPNTLTPMLVQAGGILTWSIGLIAGLSFLGQGIQPPNADWGLMVHENFEGLVLQPWSVVAPLVCIVVYSLAANTLAQGISRSVAGVDPTSPTSPRRWPLRVGGRS